MRASEFLLAKPWTPKIDPTGWWMSEKLDGMRAFWDGKELRTRNDKPIYAPEWFMAQMPKNIALDGELWLGRGRFQELISITRRHEPDDRWQLVTFMAFDAPEAAGTFEERLCCIQENEFLKRVIQRQCTGTPHLLRTLEQVQAVGGEGLMLRAPSSRYECGRSNTLLKVKTFHDAEATVIGYVDGKGKHQGRVGALIMRMSDGKLFEIGTGMSNAERENPPKIGALVTYRYQELTDAGIPRFPIFVCERVDL